MKYQKTKHTFLAMLLIVTMIFTPLSFGGEVSYAAFSNNKLVVYVAAEGKNASGAAVTVSKTAVVMETGKTAADAIQQVLDSSEYKDNYVISTTSWGKSLDSINGLDTYSVGNDWYYWSFMVNKEYAPVSIGEYELKDQDQISLIYSYDNWNTTTSDFMDDTTKNPSKEQASKLLNAAIVNKNTMAKVLFHNIFENGAKLPELGATSNGYYTVYSLVEAGLEVPEFYTNVYHKLVEDLKTFENGAALSDGTTKDSLLNSGYASPYYAKIALAVTAMGYDATDVGGINLIEKLANREIFQKSVKAADYGAYGREGMILFAIDAGNYTLPVGENYITRAELINGEMASVMDAIETAIAWNSFDSAAMAIQSLAPYVNQDVEGVDKEQVKQITDCAIGYMQTMQESNGSVGNCWTLAQVMYAAGKFDIDILDETDADFIKNGVTLFDCADIYVDTDSNTIDQELMSYQPEQLLRGYSATINAAIKAGETYTEVVTSSAVVVDPVITETNAPVATAPASTMPTIEPTTEPTSTVPAPTAAAPSSTNPAVTSAPAITAATSIEQAKIAVIADQVYTGKEITPNVKVTLGTTKLENGTDYDVAYENNKKLGTANVVVTGKGSYTGTCSTTFKIVLGKTKITKIKNGKITFKKVIGAKKYKVEIATNKKFKKTIASKISKKTSVNYSFKKGKTYYVRVCAINGKHKSSYSNVKKVK